MVAFLQLLKKRLFTGRDNERGQLLIRIGLVTLILIYVLLLPAVSDALTPQQYKNVLITIFSALVLGGILLGWMLNRPGRSDLRRIVGMMGDYSLMAAAMIQLGEPLSWAYVVVMWVTIGNGLRYGNNYLYLAVLMAVTSFTVTVLSTQYWLTNLNLAIGLVVGLAAVPLYFSKLLHKLTRASANARRASEAKGRFLANMSHEFRTPLNGLSGMTEVLATTRLDAEQRECVNTIQASARSLLAIVEDVLDISAIEAGKFRLDLTEFSPQELMQHVGLMMFPQAKAKNILYSVEIEPDVPSSLVGDARHLRQILINLIGNSIKFTERGSVRVHIENIGGDAHHPRLRFTVLDTGIGIPANLQKRLFEAFAQADVSLGRRYGGTGLGTTIAKGLVEAMKGEIGFKSEVGHGSTFWIEIPFDAVTLSDKAIASNDKLEVSDVEPVEPVEQEDDIPTSSNNNVSLTPENVVAFADPFLRHRAHVREMHILVADDHIANRMVLQRLLEKAGHVATCVNSAEEVLNALAEHDYDVTAIDLHMPGMSGLDLLKELRVIQAGASRQMPVIVLSADVTPQSINSCEQAGAYAFLAKPIEVTKLLDTLAEIAANSTAANSQPSHESEVSAVPALEITPPAIAFDGSVLDELAALDTGDGFEQKFINQCLEDIETCFKGMQRAGEEQDWQRIREQVHALKGVVSNLGFLGMAEDSGIFMHLEDQQVMNEWRERKQQLEMHFLIGKKALDTRAKRRKALQDKKTN